MSERGREGGESGRRGGERYLAPFRVGIICYTSGGGDPHGAPEDSATIPFPECRGWGGHGGGDAALGRRRGRRRRRGNERKRPAGRKDRQIVQIDSEIL